MPGGFSNPIVAGLQLLIQAIRSPNYVAGTSGWTINKDGSAEFNNLTIRGQFLGTDFIIDSAGVFFYSGTPANGNLVISLAATAGTDQFGNGYPAGLEILNHGGSGASGVVIGFNGSQPLIYFPAATTNVRDSPALFVNANGSGTAQFATLVVISDQDATQLDAIALNFDGSSQDGTHNAAITAAYTDPSSNFHALWTAGFAGTTVNGFIYAAEPGTGTSRSNAIVPETWHTASLAANWTTGGSDQAPRYRLEGIGAGVVRLDGTAYTSAAVVSGATIFTLPAGYRPSTDRRRYAGVTNASGYTAPGGTLVNIATTGVVTIGVAAGAANEQVVLDGITFPID